MNTDSTLFFLRVREEKHHSARSDLARQTCQLEWWSPEQDDDDEHGDGAFLNPRPHSLFHFHFDFFFHIDRGGDGDGSACGYGKPHDGDRDDPIGRRRGRRPI